MATTEAPDYAQQFLDKWAPVAETAETASISPSMLFDYLVDMHEARRVQIPNNGGPRCEVLVGGVDNRAVILELSLFQQGPHRAEPKRVAAEFFPPNEGVPHYYMVITKEFRRGRERIYNDPGTTADQRLATFRQLWQIHNSVSPTLDKAIPID